VAKSIDITLTIRGEVDVLRLQPGDRLIVTIDDYRAMNREHIDKIRAEFEQHFPDHEVIVLAGLRVAREVQVS
jgi:hypothetical protein